MRKGIVILIISSVMMLSTSSVYGQTTKSAGQPAAPIKVGSSLSLTGVFAENAKWTKAGYDLWLQDVNKRGGLLGRPVEMIMYDNEGSADKAVTYYERLITVDKVDLLAGSMPSMSLSLVVTQPKHSETLSFEHHTLLFLNSIAGEGSGKLSVSQLEKTLFANRPQKFTRCIL